MTDIDKIQQALNGVTYHDPDMERFKYVGFLADNKGNEVLSDLNEKEITCIALFRALDNHLQQKGDTIGLPSVDVFFKEVIKLRQSMDRKSRNEIVACIKSRSTVYNYGNAGISEDDGQKKGLLDKLMFWKRDK